MFEAADLAQLAAHGIEPAEAVRQLAMLARPAAWVDLDRPCTVGDGLETLTAERIERLRAAHATLAAAGRVSTFVPASGAATRMFRELIAARALPGELWPADVLALEGTAAGALVAFVEALPRFAFRDALAEVIAAHGGSLEHLRAHGPWRTLLDCLLGREGLDAARAPKGLLPFHRDHDECRTAFEEHLVEACALASDAAGVRTLDVTV